MQTEEPPTSTPLTLELLTFDSHQLMPFSHYTVVCLFGFNVIAKHCPLLHIEQFKIIHSIIIIVGPNDIFLIAVDSPILANLIGLYML